LKEQNIYTVSQLNQMIKTVIDSVPVFAGVYVRGEISNYKLHSSGHHYLTLKDEASCIRAVMFRGEAQRLRFRPENGMKVVVFGRLSVYPRDGQYQIYISDMLPDGVGALYLAFEQLKEKLGKEGLFDPERKKPLPRYPERISVITSPTGAAIRDILTILKKRYPLAEITVVPVLVQGSEAPADIVRAIKLVNHLNSADLIITGRGGGSIEDLWAFNDEGVARAIFRSKIPVISAVGHEPDVTIADFVADLRAATPSNAAELAVPDSTELRARLLNAERFFLTNMLQQIARGRQRLELICSKRVISRPDGYINECRLYLDRLQQRIHGSAERRVSSLRERFVKSTASIDAMSPLRVLSRGYSITQNEDGAVIKDSATLNRGDRLRIRLAKGGVRCLVEDTEVENG